MGKYEEKLNVENKYEDFFLRIEENVIKKKNFIDIF